MEKSFSKIQDYKEIFDWIFLITNKEIILPLQIKEISIILCELLNQLKPGIIPLISKKEYIYNLHYFIKACKEYGISNQNLISIQDLIENINEEKLINLLKELKKIYEKREKNKTALIKDGKKLIFKTPLKNNPKNNNPNISIQENENYLSLDFFDKNQSNNLDQTTKTKTKTKLNYIIQRNYIAGEATFYVKMFHETSLIPTILKILFDEIWITIIGADPIITKYEPRKQIKIKSRKNKLEEFFIKLHTQKYTFAANTKSEKYIIIRTLRMFLEYPALYPESNQIRGRVIGIEHEIQAVALRCCNLRQASFHINIITNTQNHYPAILRLSQYEFTISSDKNDSLSFQWSDLSINFELKILDKLSIEAIKMTVQNHNQPNETPLFLIFYNIKSTQTRLIFICLKVFSNSVTQALDDQLSNFLVDFQENLKKPKEESQIGHLFKVIDERPPMEKDDEDIIQMAESQSTLISRDTFQNRFVVDFPKYPNSSLIFQSQFLFPTINNNFVFKNHEGQYIAKLKKKIQKRIKSQKAEFSVILFTENTEEATLIFTKEKFKLVSKSRVLFEKNYDYSHRFFLDSSRELFFIIHIQKNTSYYLLRAKSSFERDLICNIFCIFKQAYFSDIENFVENQKHFQMIQVSQYHAMVSDLKHIKIMQNFLKKYLLKETQPNDLNTKDENTQNISLSKYTFCVVNSFNEFSSVAKISLEDDFFFIQTNEKQVSFEYTVYSQILPDPDFSIINFHLDKNTFLRLFLHNTEIRENFIQEFSSRRASRIKEIAEKPSVFNCSMISTLGTSPAEIILETGSFTIKNAMQENIQFPYSHLIYLHQKINGQLVFSLDYIQYFLFIFNSSQERLNFIEEFQRRNDKYVSGCFASLFSSFNITIVFKKKNASSARIMILKNTILITTSFGIYTIPYTFEITKSKHDYLHNILLHLENGIMELQFQTNKDMNEFVKLFSNPTHGVRDCSILSTEKEKKNGTELFDDFEKFAQKNSFSSEIVYQRRSITNQSQDNLNTPQNITNQFKDNLNTPTNIKNQSKDNLNTPTNIKKSKDNLNTPQNITNQFKDNLNTPQNITNQSQNNLNTPQNITNQSQNNLNTPQNITNQFKDNLNTPQNTFKKSRSLTRTYFDLKLLSQKKENHLENSSNLKQNEENTSFQISIVEENGFIETITITKQKNVLKFETQKRMLIWPIKNIKYKSSVSNQQTILELYYNNEQMTLLFNVEEKMQKFCAILDQENELKSTQILNQDDFPVYYFIVNVLNSKFHLIQKAVKVEIGFESIKCQFNPNEKIFRFNDNLQTQQLDKNSVRILKQSKVLLVASFKKQKQMKKFLKIFELVSSNQFNQGIFHVNFMLEFRKAGKITFLKNQIQFEIFDQKYEFKYNKLKLFQDKNELKKIRIQFKKKDFITEFSSFEEKNLFLRMIKKYYVFQN